MLTSRFPHEHGASRNGLRVRPGLESLPKLLGQRGYATAAFVGNWTLRDKLTGLAEHFDDYDEVFSRKRWFGMFNSEATGEDLTAAAAEWVEDHKEESRQRHPYFLWLQYVEPHAPYRLWDEFAGRLGIDAERGASKSDRYDTEVAFIDREVGRLLEGLGGGRSPPETLVIFVADHGESLGEHGYWGHGRHIYENSLRIPMGSSGPAGSPGDHQPAGADHRPGADRPRPARAAAPGWLPGPRLVGVFAGRGAGPERVTYFQAHKGAVQTDHTSSSARVAGLLEVARLAGGRKEVYDVQEPARPDLRRVEGPGRAASQAAPGRRCPKA